MTNDTPARPADAPSLVLGTPPAPAPSPMIPIADVVETAKGLGFERVEHLPGSTYQDNSTVIVIPTRGMIHHRVVSAWQNLIAPMNQKRAIMFASGHEVGKAYDAMIASILAHPELSKWRYVLCLEDDNVPPPDAHIRLLETIEWGHYDAVGGLYFTKGEFSMPQCYGDPEEYKRTGVLDFKPRDVRAAIQRGNVIPCNGVAMGCTLYRMDLFRQLPAPWFVTFSDVTPEGNVQGWTQDLFMCRNAVAAGKTFAIDARVKVGHLDVSNNVLY